MDEETFCPAHSGISEAVRRLDGWQKTQNGALIRLESKVDKLIFWIMGQLAAIVVLAVGVFAKR